MKNSLLLLLIGLTLWTCKNAQNSKIKPIQKTSFEEAAYEKQWASVARFEAKGAYKSAQAVCDSILSRAASDQNPNQLFKVLAHRSKYIHLIEEDAEEKIIEDFEAQLKAAAQPTKALLHSACGEIYLHYHERNRWKRKNRSTVEADSSNSLAYKSLSQIMQAAARHHQKALDEAETLGSYPIEQFSPILNGQEAKTAYLFYDPKAMPSLYEFLASRSLHFFKHQYRRELKPLGFQKLADSVLFIPLESFLKKEFRQADQEAADFQTLILYQKILRQVYQNKRLDALLNFELDRLAWALEESENEKRQEFYRNALNQLENTATWNQAQLSLIKLALAENYQGSANLYSRKQEEGEADNYLSKAVQLAQEFQNDSTYAGLRFKQLLPNIKQSDFSITAENTYPSKQAVLFLLNYRNLDSLHLKLYRLPQSIDNSYQKKKEMALSLWRKTPLRCWSIKLENPNDYRYHSREFYTEGLKAGRYLLLASSQANQNAELNDLTALMFNSSKLSLQSLSLQKTGKTYLNIYDRVSGKALENIKVELIKREYEPATRHYQRQVVAEYFTDSKGQIVLLELKPNHYQFRLSADQDSLNITNGLYLSSHRASTKPMKRSQIFTDRAVYKSGQLVKLKGVVMREKEVVAGEKLEVKLLDANNQVVGKKELNTNEFGSYSTSFLIPKGNLNGTFRLVDNYGQKSIEVAAYKRPSFLVKLNPLEQEVKLGDRVRLSGHIKTYSGFGLADQELRFRVVEKTTYPYWPVYSSYFPEEKTSIVAQGSVMTDLKGDFEISFQTRARKGTETIPGGIKQYTVEVKATNQAGETQQTKRRIKLSEQAIFIRTNLKQWVRQQELKNLFVSTLNINGKPLQSDLTLTLYKLEEKETAGVNRYWPEPEFGSQQATEFRKLFPQLQPKEATELSSLKRETSLLSAKIKSNKKVELFNQIKAGAYELKLETVDQFGEAVTFTQRFVLYDPYAEKVAFPSFLKINVLEDEILANEETQFSISTAMKQLPVYYQVEQAGNLIKSGVIWLNQEQKLLSFKLKAAAEPYFVHFQTIRNNRFFQQKEKITVKKTNEKLRLELIQFNSKTKPSSKENWQLKLSNAEGKPLEAEVLLGMYDQSLDVFAPNNWTLPLQKEARSQLVIRNFSFYQQNGHNILQKRENFPYPKQLFPHLNWFGLRLGGSYYGRNALPQSARSMQQKTDGIMLSEASQEDMMGDAATSSPAESTTQSKSLLRSDFSETAFFYPQLQTNGEGLLAFDFKMPDALTTWKFQAFAHSKDLKFATIDTVLISQKPLMLNSNAPRFFRSADKQLFSTSLQNNTEELQEVRLRLKFFNGFTGEPISIFGNSYQDKNVLIEPLQSKAVSWAIEVPDGLQLLSYELAAISSKHEDRERKTRVVLRNKTLITERQAFTLNQKGVSNLLFNPLLDKWSTATESESVTFELTASPKWYVLQALPYLAQTSGLRAQEVFHKLFATAIAHKLMKENPTLKETISRWSEAEQDQFNPLAKNPELKEALIEATPWEEIAKSKSQQAKSLLTLIETNQKAYNLKSALVELAQLQEESGAWPWIKGMRGNRYVTQEIAIGLAQLLSMKAIELEDDSVGIMLQKALSYLENQIETDYQHLLKRASSLNDNHLGRNQIQYLYLRSHLLPYFPFKQSKAHQYYLNQATVYWLNRPIMLQTMQALALNSLTPQSNTAIDILASLKDQAIEDGEDGLYWKQVRKSAYWQEAPIETQALLIEAFSEIMPDEKMIKQMKNWLIAQKRVQDWESSKATAYACFTLLKETEQEELNSNLVSAKVGGQLIESDIATSSPTYIRKSWHNAEVSPELGKIEINKLSDQTSWGAIYWQYFEDLDQITASQNTKLSVRKNIYKLIKSAEGEHLKPIEQAELKVGDLLTVRLEVNNSLDLEFVHLKDEFAACSEPMEQLSGYSSIEGLGYYRHIENASHNFFFERLARGKYIFEYHLRLNQKGEFQSGISKVSSQYAPEYGAHSNSMRLNIKP